MTRLARIRIETNNLDRSAEVFRAICGIESGTSTRTIQIPLQDASLDLVAVTTGSMGLTSITLVVDDLQVRQRALLDAGIQFETSDRGLSIAPSAANGLAVEILADSDPRPAAANSSARLDHVALRVENLAQASARWQAITGIEAEQMGLHPISAGSFSAARFLLGERMIELIAPVPGMESQIAARLASHGEGVAALALPVQDVDSVRRRLADCNARVIRQEPHWMVHPKDTSGILVQLTPRVEH